MKKKNLTSVLCLLTTTSLFLMGCASAKNELNSSVENSSSGNSATFIEEEGLRYTLSNEGNYYIVSSGVGLERDITIPATYNNIPIREVAENAFLGNEELESVVLSDSIVKIGNAAFTNCHNLRNVTLGENITEIGESAFSFCSALRDITIPDKVTTMGKKVFWFCRNLTDVSIGKGLRVISAATFEQCTSLQSIIIPDGVTEIGEAAFNECSHLYTVTIGKSVTKIKKNAFGGLCMIREAHFKSPEGWTIAWGDETIQVAGAELANAQTAATYFRGVYRRYDWTRNAI